MISIDKVLEYTGRIFGESLHVARVASIASGVSAVFRADTLAVAMLGRALAITRGIKPKNGIKQIDRLLSNSGIDLNVFFKKWVRFLIGARTEIVVALDWTDFDKDDASTLAIHLLTRHGRASALIWKTFSKKKLKNHRNDFEDELLVMFKDALPPGVKVTVLADRGFADVKLYAFLRELGFDFIIRFKGNTKIAFNQTKKSARAWLLPKAEALKLVSVGVTGDGYYLPAFVCMHDTKMKEAWFLAVSNPILSAAQAVKLYGGRFSIEEAFRDIKDSKYGMGLSGVRISSPQRRDRLLLLCAIASTLLTLLGAAGEAIGLDRSLKANTSPKRTHSLVFQGAHYFAAMLTMRDSDLIPLLEKYREFLAQHEVFSGTFWII